ncbi:putative winged helix-turn-helix transcription repressor DNA-binding [Rosellinia necatrix]|uniref:Putative winged helix-turn-helix transcription repressor DNA-binding n=1 Tax=Rosellinia necatrix TaxID=77044 RepID=A0A1W2TRX6_ROSNE|nr:putative winged helix-turn-helix transcription repressor DNA-binding [Rosellinia necatrix]
MTEPQGLIDTLDGIGVGDFEANDLERLQLIEAAKRLLSRIETREERMYDITFTEPIVFAALQILLDLGIWKQWTMARGVSKSVDELSELCTARCDPNLLRRLLRLLASVYMIKETCQDCYELTPFLLGNVWEWVPFRTHHVDPACINLPPFLAKTDYREPLDVKNSNYADWCPGGLNFFGKCTAEPAYQNSFSSFMTGWGKHKVPWSEFYNTNALVEGADLTNGGVLCVDVGGHHGIDLTRLLDKHPDIPAGSLVLQDLPEVVTGAEDLSEKIRVMPHDMFQPQPVKGSRSYFFHAVFHDWPDNVANRILKNITEVMTRGYSRVLIVDIVVPATGVSAIQSTMDVQMMALVSAFERTEAVWTKVLNDAGLKVVRVWKDGRGNECLIEAELA